MALSDNEAEKPAQPESAPTKPEEQKEGQEQPQSAEKEKKKKKKKSKKNKEEGANVTFNFNAPDFTPSTLDKKSSESPKATTIFDEPQI